MTKSLCISTMLSLPNERIPVWFMRQAGRYLPEYRKVRAQAGSMLNLMRTPELACEVTLQPIDRFGLDAAILFSDILTIPDAMGLGLDFIDGEGPRFRKTVASEQDVDDLISPELDSFRYVFDAVSLIRKSLSTDVALIGFAGSPFTLACYMVEGRSGTDLHKIRALAHKDPALLDRLLRKIARVVSDYLVQQYKSGAQALMIFDSWGGILPDGMFERFSLNYIDAIVSELRSNIPGREVPIIVFSRGSGEWMDSILSLDIDVVGLDSGTSITRAIGKIDRPICLQGNLDPMALFSAPEQVRTYVSYILDQVTKSEKEFGFVFNLGHGIDKSTPLESVYAMVDSVRRFRRKAATAISSA